MVQQHHHHPHDTAALCLSNLLPVLPLSVLPHKKPDMEVLATENCHLLCLQGNLVQIILFLNYLILPNPPVGNADLDSPNLACTASLCCFQAHLQSISSPRVLWLLYATAQQQTPTLLNQGPVTLLKGTWVLQKGQKIVEIFPSLRGQRGLQPPGCRISEA